VFLIVAVWLHSTLSAMADEKMIDKGATKTQKEETKKKNFTRPVIFIAISSVLATSIAVLFLCCKEKSSGYNFENTKGRKIGGAVKKEIANMRIAAKEAKKEGINYSKINKAIIECSKRRLDNYIKKNSLEKERKELEKRNSFSQKLTLFLESAFSQKLTPLLPIITKIPGRKNFFAKNFRN
jgi:hypothetical protein